MGAGADGARPAAIPASKQLRTKARTQRFLDFENLLLTKVMKNVD